MVLEDYDLHVVPLGSRLIRIKGIRIRAMENLTYLVQFLHDEEWEGKLVNSSSSIPISRVFKSNFPRIFF